ncbi:MAG: endonuclease/exonuclease/phosphatase family protein [Methanomassiliicoccales archaeon]
MKKDEVVHIKILEWNIKHGGSSERIPKIISSIISHDPDIVVITEFRTSHQDRLEEALTKGRYTQFITSEPQPRTNGIFIASKLALRPITSSHVQDGVKHRWLEVEIVEKKCKLLCLHVPGAGDVWGKEPFWRSILNYAEDNLDERVIMIGDFNTGLGIDAQGTPFVLSECMESLLEMGWTDVWRDMNPGVREYSWYSNAGNGFRLDYLYASQPMRKEVTDVRYSHSERENGHSDHSILVATIKQ